MAVDVFGKAGQHCIQIVLVEDFFHVPTGEFLVFFFDLTHHVSLGNN